MSVPSKIFIVGPRGSGKSAFAHTLAPALSAQLGGTWPVAEMSAPLINGLAPILASEQGVGWSEEYAASLIRDRKDRYRAQLAALGDFLATVAPGSLLTHCAKDARVIVGARRREEVNAFYQAQTYPDRRDVPWSTHAWVYIERPGVGLEWDRFEREFFQTQICRHHVTNNGDLALLAENAAALAREFCS